MNRIAKEQLEKCTTAKIPPFDDDTTHIRINKYNPIILKENSYYLIGISAGILNLPDNSVLTSNWNNGSSPKHTHYKCEIVKVLGEMIKITGLAFDMNTNTDMNEMWSGWLPLDGIEIIKQL